MTEKVNGEHVFCGEDGTEKQQTEILINKDYLKYKLTPSIRHKTSQILFYNAQDLTFYDRKPENPIFIIWLVRHNVEFNYVTRRLLEEAFEMNIWLVHLQTENFEISMDSDGLEHLYYKGKVIKYEDLPDAVMPRIGATIDYHSLMVLRHLELMGGNMINDVKSLETSRDKLRTYQALASKNLPIPKTMLVRFPSKDPKYDGNVDTIIKHFKFPIILKLGSGSKGKGVMLVNSEENFKDLFDMLDQTNPLLVQEFIKNSTGKDIRVIVVGNKVVSCMMRVAKKGFKSNFHQGGYVKTVEITEELEKLAVLAAQTAGLQIAGIDLLIDENRHVICEVNSSPGFEGFEMATGINTARKMLEYVMTTKRKEYVKVEKIHVPIIPKHLE